jgi:hypothetical protein
MFFRYIHMYYENMDKFGKKNPHRTGIGVRLLFFLTSSMAGSSLPFFEQKQLGEISSEIDFIKENKVRSYLQEKLQGTIKKYKRTNVTPYQAM